MGPADTHYTTSYVDTFHVKQMNEGLLVTGTIFPPQPLKHQLFTEESLFPSLDIFSYLPCTPEFLMIKPGLIGTSHHLIQQFFFVIKPKLQLFILGPRIILTFIYTEL